MDRGKIDVEKARYWQQRLSEAARSGMSIREYCRRRRLKESQFYWWQRQLRLSRQEGGGSRPGVNGPVASFALGSEAAGATDAGIELVLSGGQRLRITKGVDEATLRTVLGALEPGRC
jgi:transposase-like protein